MNTDNISNEFIPNMYKIWKVEVRNVFCTSDSQQDFKRLLIHVHLTMIQIFLMIKINHMTKIV